MQLPRNAARDTFDSRCVCSARRLRFSRRARVALRSARDLCCSGVIAECLSLICCLHAGRSDKSRGDVGLGMRSSEEEAGFLIDSLILLCCVWRNFRQGRGRVRLLLCAQYFRCEERVRIIIMQPSRRGSFQNVKSHLKIEMLEKRSLVRPCLRSHNQSATVEVL